MRTARESGPNRGARPSSSPPPRPVPPRGSRRAPRLRSSARRRVVRGRRYIYGAEQRATRAQGSERLPPLLCPPRSLPPSLTRSLLASNPSRRHRTGRRATRDVSSTPPTTNPLDAAPPPDATRRRPRFPPDRRQRSDDTEAKMGNRIKMYNANTEAVRGYYKHIEVGRKETHTHTRAHAHAHTRTRARTHAHALPWDWRASASSVEGWRPTRFRGAIAQKRCDARRLARARAPHCGAGPRRSRSFVFGRRRCGASRPSSARTAQRT